MDEVICHVRVENKFFEPFRSNTELHQDNSLSCLFFNIALEKIIRNFNIETKAYADNIDIIRKSTFQLK